MQHRHTLNLTRLDRWGYVAGGLALLAWGLGRRSLTRGSAAGLGGWLLYQAYTGNNPMFEPLGIRVNPQPEDADAHETIVHDEPIVIGKSADEVYRFWRDLNNLPRIAPKLKALEVLDQRHSRWHVQDPRGGTVQWEAEITRDEPGREIAWRTTHERQITHFGDVRFENAPGGRGSIVRVHLEYVSPAGSFGAAVASVTAESPRWMVKDALRRLKQLLETGEIATTQGQPSGRARQRPPAQTITYGEHA
jgi:uncharacterized membrane protein